MSEDAKGYEEGVTNLYDDIRKLVGGVKAGPGLDALIRCIAMVVVHISIIDEVPSEVIVKDLCEDLAEQVNVFMGNYKSGLIKKEV